MGYLNAGTVQEKAFPRMKLPAFCGFSGPYPAGCADEKLGESGTDQCAVRLGATTCPSIIIDFGWNFVLVHGTTLIRCQKYKLIGDANFHVSTVWLVLC